jgi:hypothetical protein
MMASCNVHEWRVGVAWASDEAISRSRSKCPPQEIKGFSMLETRRTAVYSLTGAAVTGAGLVQSGCAKAANETGGSDKVTANEDLMREHGILRRILIIYREVAPKLVASAATVDASALKSAAKLFQAFGERYHEQLLEEQHIFPIVRKAALSDCAESGGRCGRVGGYPGGATCPGARDHHLYR